MHGTAPLSNPQHFPELELTTPLPVKNLAPTILSHMTSTRWDTPSLASNCSATHTFLGPNDPELPSFGFESSFPSPLHAQLYPEGMVYLHGTDFGHYDPFPHTTHHQAPSFSRSVNLDLLVGNSTIVSNVPGFRVDQPPATPTRSPPASTPGLSQNGSTEHTGGVWKFLRMCSDNRYECLWDDGSGGLCRYSGTLVGVKRHLGRAHRLKRCALDFRGAFDRLVAN